ncbi:hypothetical protein DFJ74DRAFT_687687 [Hyaloraphidium curvatum]|nr:hypothetical protein DFJ74DRAFT_687687 [Hyaloraphidium curvatum]
MVGPPALTDNDVRRLLTAPGSGSPFEITRVVVRGIEMNAWKHANRSMRSLWLDSAANGDKPYLTFIDNSASSLSGPSDPRLLNPRTLTYREAHEQSAALALAFKASGLQRGDRVAIAARNCIEWIVSFWAVVSIGCVVSPINAWLPAKDMEYCLTVGEPVILIADGERLARFIAAGSLDRLREKHGLRKIISIFPESFLDGLALPSSPFYSDFQSFVAPHLEPARRSGMPAPLGPGPAEMDPDEATTLFFSSGTSGFPKGCLGTNRSYCQTPLTALYRGVHAAVKKAGGLAGMPPMPKATDPVKAQVLTTPLFHITATKSRLGGSTFTGGTVVFLYKWNAADCLRVTSHLRVNSIGGVPTMFYNILDAIEKAKRSGQEMDLSCVTSLSYGGAPCPAALVDKLREVFPGCSIGQGYGLTESSNNVSIAGDDYLTHPGSVGKLNPVSEMKIVEITDWDSVSPDHQDREVPVGEVGELCFRGANVIKEYYKNPEATKRAFRGGWFHTGDVGYIDKEGFVYLVDRSKEMIVRGGENIYTVSIEEALYRLPGVWDAGAIGIPDPGITLGELPVAAVVVRRTTALPTSESIRQFCRTLLPAFSVPVYVDVRIGEGDDAGLPRNQNGKLKKNELREQILRRMNSEGVVEQLKGGGAGAKL